MKWFFKVLRHYADFSGRARRKEFWMFALFNVIFAFVWSFLMTLAFVLFNQKDIPIEAAANIANWCYWLVVMLPSMAVSVRRFHDLGKSGWMLCFALIPFFGSLWLLMVMATEGQQGDNRYGPDPKTSPETFTETQMLKSAGNVLIVASAAGILLGLVSIIFYLADRAQSNPMVYFVSLTNISAYILMLIAGSLLLNEKQKSGLQEKGKNAMVALFISVILSFVLLIYFRGKAPAVSFFSTMSYLFVALLAATVLFSSVDKILIRKMAITAVVFSGLHLLWFVYNKMEAGLSGFNEFGWFFMMNTFQIVSVLVPVAFLVLAGTFLSKGDKN